MGFLKRTPAKVPEKQAEPTLPVISGSNGVSSTGSSPRNEVKPVASKLPDSSSNDEELSSIKELPQIDKAGATAADNHSAGGHRNTTQKKSYVPPAHIVKHGPHGTDKKSTFNNQESTLKTVNKNYNMKITEINKLLKKNTQEIMSSLTPEVRKAFENLYDRIDISDSGGITPKEIQNLVSKYTKEPMTMQEISFVLTDLDMKGTGDIEFDEFIYMLSQPENYVRLLDADDLQKIQKDITDRSLKQRLNDLTNKRKYNKSTPTSRFFRALRAATQQESMTILRNFYTNRLKKLNDHVIHDWSAGQRCIGLSDQEMVKRYETIQAELLRQKVNFCKDNSYRSSPYAKPLEWGLLTLREGIDQRRKAKLQEMKTTKMNERRAKISEFVCTPKAVPLPKYEIHKRHPLKKSFDYDQLAGIREKVEVIAGTYYNDLKDVARESSQIVRKELAVGEIKNINSRQNFHWTFKAYCAPFVVSPWIPMPRPTLQASFTPLGKSKLASQVKW